MPCVCATTIFSRDREAARAATRRISRRLLSRGDADAWHALGAALVALEDRAGALAAFGNALRLDEHHAGSRLALGNLLFDCGQCERALSWFGMASEAR